MEKDLWFWASRPAVVVLILVIAVLVMGAVWFVRDFTQWVWEHTKPDGNQGRGRR